MSTNGRVILPDELPVFNYREAAPHLRRPFTANAIKFKVQSQFGGKKDDAGKKYIEPPAGGVVIAYIDARLVIEHLNKVCPHLWSHRFEIAAMPGSEQRSYRVKCWLTIDGITREDVGQASGMEAYKGAHSDALKRAAKMFGVGVSLHAIPRITLFAGKNASNLAVRGGEKRGYSLALTEATIDKLRDGYQGWLEREGIAAFGEPLDHGDVLGSQGDPDVPQDEPDEPTEALFEDPEPPKQPGRKIKAEEAEEFAERFNREAPEHVTPDDLNLKLRELTGKDEGETLELLRSLRGSQLAALDGWLEAVKTGALA